MINIFIDLFVYFFTFIVGCAWNAFRNNLIGMTSPLIGPPSIISYLPIESVSVYVEGPLPVCSRRIISTSIYLILTRTSMNEILPKHKEFLIEYWPYNMVIDKKTYNCFIQMISCFIVFEFDVKWIFDPNLKIKSYMIGTGMWMNPSGSVILRSHLTFCLLKYE